MPERNDAAQLLARKRRIDAERRRRAVERKAPNNVSAMHRVASAVK